MRDALFVNVLMAGTLVLGFVYGHALLQVLAPVVTALQSAGLQ